MNNLDKKKNQLPPYGRELLKRIKQGYQLANGVNIYTSWNMGKNIPRGVTFPPDALPDEYDWSFLAGQEISLINTNGVADYEKLRELSILLIKSGVKNVGLIDSEHPLQWFIPVKKGEAA